MPLIQLPGIWCVTLDKYFSSLGSSIFIWKRRIDLDTLNFFNSLVYNFRVLSKDNGKLDRNTGMRLVLKPGNVHFPEMWEASCEFLRFLNTLNMISFSLHHSGFVYNSPPTSILPKKLSARFHLAIEKDMYEKMKSH